MPPSPTAYVSYARGASSWNTTVLDFATALRTAGGVDADLDIWHLISGRDWTTYGPSAVRSSDCILIAASPEYDEDWRGVSSSTVGRAREVAAIKGIFDRDLRDFQRRVKIVLLPGSSEGDIPIELRSLVERFEIASFDLRGLELLLRSILARPAHVKPALGRLPALPHRLVSELTRLQPGTSGPPELDGSAVADPADDDRLLTDKLGARLQRIAEELSSDDPNHLASETVKMDLREERAVLASAVAALQRSYSPFSQTRQPLTGDEGNSGRTWVIGAAPQQEPYWTLFDARGNRAARLFLGFGSRTEAVNAIQARVGELAGYVVRTLYELQIHANARMVAVDGSPRLQSWVSEILAGRADQLPPELGENADVVLLPRGLSPGQLLVVSEEALGKGLAAYTNPKPLSL